MSNNMGVYKMADETGGLSAEQLEVLRASLKMSSDEFTKFAKDMAKANVSLKTIKDSLDKEVKSIKSNREELNKLFDEEKIHIQSLSKSMSHLSGVVIAGATKSLMGVATSALKSGDALQVTADLMKSMWDIGDQAAQSGAKNLIQFGKDTAGAGGKIGAAGKAATVMGESLSILSGAVSSLAKSGIDFILSKTREFMTEFTAMSAAGAIYTGGMNEMIKTANDAGLSLGQFSKAVSANKEVLTKSGLGVAEGSKRMAAAMASGGIAARDSLFALGMSMEDQAEATAQTMAIMAGPAGRLQSSNAEVAAQTQEYAKNLKFISGLTGEDIKAKQATIAKENATLFMKQTMDKMSVEDRIKFKAMQDSMSEDDRQAMAERLKYGTVITDKLAVAAATNSGIASLWDQQFSAVKDGSMSAVKGAEIQAANAQTIYNEGMKATALGISTNQLAIEASNVQSRAIDYSAKITAEGIESQKKGVQSQVDAGKKGTDPATQLMSSQQKLALITDKLGSKLMPQFAETVDTTIKNMEWTITKGAEIAGLLSAMPPWVAPLAGAIGTLTTSILGMIAANRIQAALKGGTAGLAETFANTAGSGAGADKVAGGMGKNLESISKGADSVGKGPGSGIAGFLKSIAAGLKAFAAPQVILGTAIVTGAMIGMAYAFNLAGPAMEPFGKMLKSVFEGIGVVIMNIGTALATVITGIATAFMVLNNVDALHLISLAPGIVAVGAALGVAAIGFGAFAVVNSTGGVESTITGLKKFESLNPDKLVKVADAMRQVSASMPGAGQMAVAAATGLFDKLSNAVTGGGTSTELRPVAAESSEGKKQVATGGIGSGGSTSAVNNELLALMKEQVVLLRQLTDQSKEHVETSKDIKRISSQHYDLAR